MTDTVARLTKALAGRYRIERELGAGGMATVYLAYDLRHDRQVAVKVLRPELAAVLGAERFLHEIRVTANLQHPHILPLHDSGEATGLLFYVMPFIEGESLREKLKRETELSLDEALRIAQGVASALDYAHRRGVVHRDIKPENILLHDGQPTVADFGISLAVSQAGGSRLTETGLSFGTPQYMSPEQTMGDREVDSRSDVYSLGCVVYEMLGGEPPYTGPTAQAILAKVLTERPRRLGSLRDTVPAHVEAAVQRALAKLPADRFPSAAAFAEALARPDTSPRASTPSGLTAVQGAASPASRRRLCHQRLDHLKHDVLRLDGAMHDAPLVRELQRGGDRPRSPAPRPPRLVAVEQATQRFAFRTASRSTDTRPFRPSCRGRIWSGDGDWPSDKSNPES